MPPLLQFCEVVVSLPQDSAETSNTLSNRRPGFLYGFFPGAASGVLSFMELFVSNDPSLVRLHEYLRRESPPLIHTPHGEASFTPVI